MSDKLHALNCKTCAAPLQRQGGHQVRTLTCGYCGTVMDVRDEFKVLAQYEGLERPTSPFRLGMQGEIKGVMFTVIGIIGAGYEDRWGRYDWVSAQLFSPTHGYAWLTWNQGHFVFARRVRELPKPSKFTGGRPKRTKIRFRDQKFRFYEGYQSELTFVEGELTWQAALHERTKVAEFIAPPLGFEFEASEDELAYGLSEYMERDEIRAAFGIAEPLPAPVAIHPLQPFKPGALQTALSKAGYIFTIIAGCCLVITFVLGSGWRIQKVDQTLAPGSTLSVPFSVSRADQLVDINIETALDNSWTYIEGTVSDSSDQTVAVIGREIGYYHGVEGGESWSEGSRGTTASIRVPAPGDYRLDLEVDPESPVTTPGRIIIEEGVMPLRYFFVLLVFFALMAASLPIRRRHFEKQRWSEVLDDDD